MTNEPAVYLDEIITEKQYIDESMFEPKYTLKNGQTLTNPEHAYVLNIISTENIYSNYEYKWDDLSLSELFSKCYSHNTLYCPELKQWYSYDGRVWCKDLGSILVTERFKDFARLLDMYCWEALPEDTDKTTKTKFLQFITKLGNKTTRDRVLKDCQSAMTITINQFDADPYLINCLNGTYNLLDGSFHQHDAKDYLTLKTNCNYPTLVQILTFDRWEKFIDEITCGDKNLAKYIQKALGYSLIGLTNEECMFIAYGKTTRNGKGTLLNTIQYILGDYGSTIDVSFICTSPFAKNYTSANPMLCALKPTRFLTMSESADDGKLDEALIKNYTGGDPISTRPLYGEMFSFLPQFTMWLSCNTLPEIQDKSLFASDRIKVIPFNKHFDENSRDKTLKEQFKTNDAKTVIFKWLLEGYKLYKEEGLKDIEPVKEQVQQYEEESDITALFLKERTVFQANARVKRQDFYNAYKVWCKQNGLFPKSSLKFYKDCERCGLQTVNWHNLLNFKDLILITRREQYET